MKFLLIIAVAFTSVHSLIGAFKLDNPPTGWNRILQKRVSFDGNASLNDFIDFIFLKSDANVLIQNRSKTELHIKASFKDLTLMEVLQAISSDFPVDVSWGYRDGFDLPSFIEIGSGPIDLMRKDIDFSKYPKSITLIPKFTLKAEQDAAANP